MAQFETFQVDQSKGLFLRAKRGAIVYVPAQTFVDAEGNVPPRAVVRIKEIIDNEDLFEYGIATVNRDSVLVTGGIIYIEAKDLTGKDLKIAKDGALLVQIPGDNPTASIKIARGEMLDSNRLTRVDVAGGQVPVPQVWSTVKQEIDIIQPGQLIQVQSVGGRTISVDDANRVKSGFTFKIGELGWFMLYNRIRDVTTDEGFVDLHVRSNRGGVRMILVPRRFTALVTPTEVSKDHYVFKGLPNGESYTLISYAISGAQYFYVQKMVVFGKDGVSVKKGKADLKIELQSVSLEYLRAALGAF